MSLRSMDSPRGPDSPGADARSEGGGSVAAKELTEEQKVILKKSRPVMLVLLVFFIGIALHDTARLYVCVVQLIAMGVLSMSWDEEYFLNANSDMSIKQRISGLFLPMWRRFDPHGGVCGHHVCHFNHGRRRLGTGHSAEQRPCHMTSP